MMQIGDFEIISVVNGTIRLDGGAMFGVVPKVLWQNITDVDADNRILLATRSLIAVHRHQHRVFLVDTGCGSKWDPEMAQRFGIQIDTQAVPDALATMGLSEKDVTDVVISHLHFDHNGGLTNWVDDPDGPTQLKYPAARHWIHRRHWDHAGNPHAKDRASFIKADFESLGESGSLCFVEGDEWQEGPIEGLQWFATNGHTPGQLHPVFSGGDQTVVFSGDIIPTANHLRLGWVMAYDLEPLVTIAEKERLCRDAIQHRWIVAFPHDPAHGAVLLDGRAERPIVNRAVDL